MLSSKSGFVLMLMNLIHGMIVSYVSQDKTLFYSSTLSRINSGRGYCVLKKEWWKLLSYSKHALYTLNTVRCGNDANLESVFSSILPSF